MFVGRLFANGKLTVAYRQLCCAIKLSDKATNSLTMFNTSALQANKAIPAATLVLALYASYGSWHFFHARHLRFEVVSVSNTTWAGGELGTGISVMDVGPAFCLILAWRILRQQIACLIYQQISDSFS